MNLKLILRLHRRIIKKVLAGSLCEKQDIYFFKMRFSARR